MEQSILYYNNETNSLYFDGVNDFEIENYQEKTNNFLVIMLYLLGFYHLSWYIINTSRKFRSEEISCRLMDCRTIFRILNEKFEMFDKDSVETMNTSVLLENTLEFFNIESDEEANEDSENSEEGHSNEEIEAAKTLTSMGKNWEFDQ